MEKRWKIHKGQLMYIPKEIEGMITSVPKVIPNRKGIYMFNPDSTYEEILHSLETIKLDIQGAILERDRKENESR